jgi:hypothetical protein
MKMGCDCIPTVVFSFLPRHQRTSPLHATPPYTHDPTQSQSSAAWRMATHAATQATSTASPLKRNENDEAAAATTIRAMANH